MLLTKVKTLYPLSLNEVKSHLRIDLTITEDDDYINNFIIKSATRYAENYIDKDIALTTNTYTEEDFYGSWLRINEGNLISITDVSINGTLYSDYELEKWDDHFIIDWDGDVKGGDDYTLTTHFITGYNQDECPEEIKQAIMIKCGDFYDVERSSFILSGIKKSDVVERILGKYRCIRW